MDITTLGILVIGVSLIAGLVLLIAGFRSFGTQDATARLQEFVTYHERPKGLSAAAPSQIQVQQNFSDTFFDRTIGSFFKRFITFLGQFTPSQTIENTNRQLGIIPNPRNIRAREFFGIRLALMLFGLAMAFLINLRNFDQLAKIFQGGQRGVVASVLANSQSSAMLLVYSGLVIAVFFFLLPIAWLSSQVRKVKYDVAHALPDALDMLSVCADAGLGFDQALQRVGEYMQNVIGTEFKRVIAEMEVGVSRSDALRNMSDRLEVSELSSFVSVIIQSDALGMRIADVLHSQAEQMRIIRQFKAKEIAYKLPAQMIIPLAVFILPAMFVVILGPIVPRFFKLLG